MIPFTTTYNFYRALRWLKLNAKGDCSILVATPGAGILRVEHAQKKALWYFVQREAQMQRAQAALMEAM